MSSKPLILLIGDSIRMGYQPFVQQSLADLAEVTGPADNGGHTPNLLVHLHLWVLNRTPAPALVHLNAGLHDLKTTFYNGRDPIVPVDHYRRNVHVLLSTILERTTAKVIWALTTPVQDALHHREHAQWNDFDRTNEAVLRYNDAACSVCSHLNVPINNLYSAATSANLAQIQTADGVHFTAEGSRLLAQSVTASIRAALPI